MFGDFMSMGYGAICRLIDSDEDWLTYEYTSYNLNHEDSEKAINTLDGIITIHKYFFPESQIIRKRIRKSNGKKEWIDKKKYETVDLGKFIDTGKIIIENSSHCWYLTQTGMDIVAMKLLFYLQIEYEKTGKIPKSFSIFS